MAKQRVINTRFWDDGYVSTLAPLEKLMFLYVLTNPLTDLCGAYEITLKRIVADTDLSQDEVVSILKKFEAKGKIIYHEGWMIVRNFAKHQVNNPKVSKGVERSLSACPDWVKDTLSKPIDSLSKPIAPEPIPVGTTQPEPVGNGDETPPTPDDKPEARILLPRDFLPDSELLAWAKENAPSVDPISENEEFVTFWREIATKNNRRTRRGWIATWKKRMKEMHKQNGASNKSYREQRADEARISFERTAEIRRRVEQRDRELSGKALPDSGRQLPPIESHANGRGEGREV